MKKIIFLYLLFFISQFAFAYSLNDIKEMAVSQSSLLSAMEFEKKALEFEQHLKSKWQNPQFISQIGTLKSGASQGNTLELTLTQAVPLSSKYSMRESMAKVVSEINQLDRENKLNWVAHQAIISAYKAHVYAELEKHAVERKKRFELIRNYLEVQPKITSKQMVEAALIGGQILMMENTLSLKRMEAEMALAEIEFWTGKRIKVSEIEIHIPHANEVKIHFEDKTELDPELQLARLEMNTSKLDLNLAQVEKRPDLIFGGGYRVEKVDPANHFSYGVVGLTLPLWDTGSNRVESAKARVAREEKMADETKKSVFLKHRQQLLLTEHALDLFKRFPLELAAKQERIFTIAHAGFKQGVVDANLFLQSESQCHELIDNVYLNFLSFIENLSRYQLMRGEAFSWN